MGVDIELKVVDSAACTKQYLPAYEAAKDGSDVRAFAVLLRRAWERAPEKRPGEPWQELDRDPDLKRQEQEARAALAEGNPLPMKEYSAAYADRISGPPGPQTIKADLADPLPRSRVLGRPTRIAPGRSPSQLPGSSTSCASPGTASRHRCST